jgi:hypothetical protein
MTPVRQQIDAIFRSHPPKKQKILAGMAQRAKQLDERFYAKARHRAEVREALSPSLHNLRQLVDVDAKAAKKLEALRKARPRKLPPVNVLKRTDRIFSGSLGATIVPPYDWAWTHKDEQGDPPEAQQRYSADANSGTMQLEANVWDASSVQVDAAVGVWLIAPLGTASTMTISAAPAFSWSYNAFTEWSSEAESLAQIGIVVQRFDRQSGTFIDTIVDNQFNWLWDATASILGTVYNEGSTTGYPLQVQFTGEKEYFYTVWVEGIAYASGGSMAWAFLDSISVPWITWLNT